MNRVLLPPLSVNLLLLALAVYCLSSQESLAVEKQDSSVQFAAALVLVASIIGYPILLIINLLDSVFDRHGFRSWLWTACLISGFATFTLLRAGLKNGRDRLSERSGA